MENRRNSSLPSLKRRIALTLALILVMIYLTALGVFATVSGNVTDSDGLLGNTDTSEPAGGTDSGTASATNAPTGAVTKAPTSSDSVTDAVNGDGDGGSIIGIIIAIVIIVAVVIIIIVLIPKKNG